MAGTEGVIFTFRPFRKTAYAVLHPVLSECFASACDDLVRIGLMPHIKHQFVGGCVIDIMETDYEFYGTEA